MGFLKKLLIKEEETEEVSGKNGPIQKESVVTVTTSSSAPNQVAPPVPTPTCQSSTPQTEEDPEQTRRLWSLVLSRNLPGPDYLEVRAGASSLRSMGLSEEKTWEAAFRTVMAQNPEFTQLDVNKSIEIYRNLVKEEEKKGLAQAEEKLKSLVGAKATRLELLESEVSNFDQKLLDLEKKYQEDRDNLISEKAAKDQEILTLKADIAERTEEIEVKKSQFKASVNSVLAELDHDQKLNNSITIQ